LPTKIANEVIRYKGKAKEQQEYVTCIIHLTLLCQIDQYSLGSRTS
jgi:hypothetical protein